MHFPRYEDQDTQLLFSKWQNQKTTSVPFLIEKIWSKLYVLRNFDWEMLRCSKKPRLKHKLPITLSFSYCCKKRKQRNGLLILYWVSGFSYNTVSHWQPKNFRSDCRLHVREQCLLCVEPQSHGNIFQWILKILLKTGRYSKNVIWAEPDNTPVGIT